MSFQILNKEGQPLTMKELDADACAIWNKLSDPKYYANPSPQGTDVFKQATNWFDCIGYNIHNPEVEYTTGWNNVKCSLWTLHVQGLYETHINEILVHIEVVKEYLEPYYRLIDHWEAKGYQPKQVKE